MAPDEAGDVRLPGDASKTGHINHKDTTMLRLKFFYM